MKRYSGTTPDGCAIQSLYPNLYRVQYRPYIGGRMIDVDKVVSACDEYHARERCSSGFADIRGAIEVEYAGALTAELVEP
jgi:hypothetical protein